MLIDSIAFPFADIKKSSVPPQCHTGTFGGVETKPFMQALQVSYTVFVDVFGTQTLFIGRIVWEVQTPFLFAYSGKSK